MLNSIMMIVAAISAVGVPAIQEVTPVGDGNQIVQEIFTCDAVSSNGVVATAQGGNIGQACLNAIAKCEKTSKRKCKSTTWKVEERPVS